MTEKATHIGEILNKYEKDLLPRWISFQSANARGNTMKQAELEMESREFLRLFTQALDENRDGADTTAPTWSGVRDFLGGISRSRAKAGFTPSETARFIFSLKEPLFDLLRKELKSEPQALVDDLAFGNRLLDDLGLYTTEVFQKSLDEILSRQQEEMLELSTPVVELWEGILALPLIGTLDSARTQIVMESLLQKIVETGSGIAIIDITGVPTVDTLVAQHLLKTVAAARLMGAECIISGIRPQIAQTIVHLGVDLGNVITKATLAHAFSIALERADLQVCKRTEA